MEELTARGWAISFGGITNELLVDFGRLIICCDGLKKPTNDLITEEIAKQKPKCCSFKDAIGHLEIDDEFKVIKIEVVRDSGNGLEDEPIMLGSKERLDD
jgi:hypothetical protein